MDCVVPLMISTDLGRFDLLCDSIACFYPDITNLFAITRGKQPKARYPFIRWIDESDLLTREWMQPNINGWYRQQALKLISHKLVTTAFYWCLDADCFFVKRFDPEFVISENKAGIRIYSKGPPDWWSIDAGKALGIPSDQMSHEHYDVTPNVFSKEAVAITERYFLHQFGSWENGLLKRLPWTEYQLHYGLMKHLKLFDMFYFQKIHSYTSLAIWHRNDIKRIRHNVSKNLYSVDSGLISLVQSNQGMPPHVYAEELSQLWLQEPFKVY